MVAFYVTFFVVVLASAALLFLYRTRKDAMTDLGKVGQLQTVEDKTSKIICIVWMSLYLLNLLLPNAFAMRTFDNRTPYESGENIYFALFVWFNDVAFLVIPVALFQKHEVFKKIAAYFSLAVCLVNATLLQIYRFLYRRGK